MGTAHEGTEQVLYFVEGDYVRPCKQEWGWIFTQSTFGEYADKVLRVWGLTPGGLVMFAEEGLAGRRFGQSWFDHVTPEGVLIAQQPANPDIGLYKNGDN